MQGGWPKVVRKREHKKCAFLGRRMNSHSCKQGVLGVLKSWPKGGSKHVQASPTSLAQDVVCVCVCVCVGEELQLMQASTKAWGAHSQMRYNSLILLIETSFYRKNMSCMHVAPIPTLWSYFSLFVCVWLAFAVGFSLCILIRIYSKVTLIYLNFIFTHSHIHRSLI